MAKKIIEHNTRTTDLDTGEFQEITKTVTVRTDSQEEFFMLFIKAIGPVFKIKSLVDFKVLLKLCQLSVYNGGSIPLPTLTRKEICEELSLQNPNLSNSLNRLRTMGVITGSQGKFELNPIIAWKGDLKTRDKAIKKMQLDFKIQYQSTKFD